MGVTPINGTMEDVLAAEKRRAGRGKQNLLQRAARNIIRLPQRAARTLSQWTDPNYRLQRAADRATRGWMSRDDRRRMETLIGPSSYHTCRLLGYLASTCPGGGCIAEIGAWKGKSAVWLVEGSTRRRDPLKVVSIDPHEFGSWETFCSTVEQFRLKERGLTVERGSSHVLGPKWTRPISLLWVDGGHDYDDVRQDIENYVPHVIPGGWVVFDDAEGGTFPGTEQAIAELMHHRQGYQRVAVSRHLQIFQREAVAHTKAG